MNIVSQRTIPIAGALVVAAVTAVLALGSCGKATTPAAARAAAVPPAWVFTTPLHNVEVGEVLTLRHGSGDGETINEFRVVAVSDTAVRLVTTTVRGGAVANTREVEVSKNNFGIPPGSVIQQMEMDRLLVGDKRIDVLRLRVRSQHDSRFIWLSPELPVHGVARIEKLKDGRPGGLAFNVDVPRSAFADQAGGTTPVFGGAGRDAASGPADAEDTK